MKLRRLAFGLLMLGAAVYTVEALLTLRPLRSVVPRGGESCKRIEVDGLIGAEDMEFDHATATLWIAAADRRGAPSFRPHPGAFFRWRPDSEPAPLKVQLTGLTGPLRPHGMGLHKQPSGELRIFAVQHGETGESVEIFRAEQEPEGGGLREVLRHVRSVRDPAFISINDVAATGPESFYVTNDHGRPPRWGHVLEDFALLSRASLVYFDGSAARTVESGLRYANGVSVDPDGRYVLVAETTARRLSVFARTPDGGLQGASRTALDTAPDNLARDEHGRYFIGAHPSTFQFLRHARAPGRSSASQALRFRLGPDGAPTELTTVWIDDGKAFSGSSVAAVHGRFMIVGGVFDRGVLVCQTS
jgi:arylesterase/paraoxonase